MPSQQRARRVGEQIQKEISDLLLKGLKDPRIGFITITEVEVTPDLGQARVYFTVIGDDKSRKESEAGLSSSASFLRRELGRRLHLRSIPELKFLYDESLAYGQRIDELLEQVRDQQQDNDTEDS